MTVTESIRLDENNVIRTSSYEGKTFPGGIGLECFKAMKTFGENVAQIDPATGESDTFNVVLRNSIRTALTLRTRGITPGDIVVLCSSNNRFSSLPLFASQFLGAKFSAFDPSLSPNDVAHLVKVVRPKIIFVEPQSVELIENALRKNNVEIEVVVLGETKKHTEFAKFLEEKGGEEEFRPAEVESDDCTAVILCSSGTTGFPKGIELSHHVLLNHASRFRIPGRLIAYASLYWISATLVTITQTLQGGTWLLFSNFEPRSAWNYMLKYDVNFALLTTTLTADLVNYAASENPAPVKLKAFYITGEKASLALMEKTKQVFPGAIVGNGYGQTEAGGNLTAFQVPDDVGLLLRKPESVGRPIAGISYRVVDIETGKNLSFNQPGELRVKSKYLMNGYHNMDASSTYDEEGWLKTGDIVYYDEDFCFFVIDRIKEVIKYRSWHVPPAFIEKVLNSHPAIAASVVVGIPHETDVEHPLACVILNKDAVGQVEEKEIVEFVNEQVDERKKLRAGVKFVKSFPLTATGKIARRLIKEAVMKGQI